MVSTIGMEESNAQRVRAGLSLLFAPGERPDVATLRSVIAGCQAQAALTCANVPGDAVELIVSGLAFDVMGLAPVSPRRVPLPADRYFFDDDGPAGEQEAVTIAPSHHLSGGVSLSPVIRAMLALAAELAVALPATAVLWHPADTAIEPGRFSRSVLAWLAGGAFPAMGLTSLSALADGSVVSRGLKHFVGQELTFRGGTAAPDVLLATRIVDRIIQEGPLTAFKQWRIQDVLVSAEPAREAKQILAWRVE